MKVVILAGGFGTRISEESQYKPKPMVEIGEMPILWHIMKIYSHYGINEFIICAGYKQHVIKEWFNNYFLHTSDVTFDFKNDEIIVHNRKAEQWKVTIVDTGLNTQTGGRVKRIKDFGQNKGVVEVAKDGVVKEFREKSDLDGNLINIGFMVFEPQIFDYIAGDAAALEKEPLCNLARENELSAYTHKGFWQCMDTLREKQQLESLWQSGEAPWKVW